MGDDEQTRRQRFEPPPWEQEAFERFRTEQEELRKQAELDAALRAALERPADGGQAEAADDALPAASAPPAGAGSVSPAAPASESTEAALPGSDAPQISDARIDSMLIQLRGEEPSVRETNMALVNTVIGAFVVAGLYIIVQAALLFGQTRAEGAGGMLGATASLVVLLTGVGFLAGGFLLFRKHHM